MSETIMQRRRIAQWESTSTHTEEAAAFNSCSAYQSRKQVLFLSPCVPDPPDKGERIRAHHVLNHLAARYQIHLVCFAQNASEMDNALALKDRCASVWVEHKPKGPALARAAVRFAMGQCLTTAFFDTPAMRRRVSMLRKLPLSAAVVFSSAMAQYAPPDVPLILDMADVDSEKWLQYSLERWPKWAYRAEARRLRQVEINWAGRALKTFFASPQETDLFQSIAPGLPVECIENGVDLDYFDPDSAPALPGFGRTSIAFVGAMDYYPNIQAVRWFANTVFPEVRSVIPQAEFWIVGRNPSRKVRELRAIPGVWVTGTVPDVRPYLAASQAVVAPLRIARGIQNKAIEALAMGRCVLASPQVCATFAGDIPSGVIPCDSPADFVAGVLAASRRGATSMAAGRAAAAKRFSWHSNLRSLSREIDDHLQAGSALASGVRAS